jgi:hypothetical protein
MHPDDVLSILTARPFLPFDVELPNNTTFRITDGQTAMLSPTKEALVVVEASGAKHTIALRHIIRISTDPMPGRSSPR